MRAQIADVPKGADAAMRRLAVDAAAVAVLGALAAQRVPCILIKGVALQRRLYGDGALRRYGDVDLLVPPDELPRAREVLSRLEFARRLDPLAHPFRMPEPHAEEWRRGPSETVDLHWGFDGVGATGDRLWRALFARTETIELGGLRASVPDGAASALLIALHAAQHGTGVPKVGEDLQRGLLRIPRDDWQEAARLAAELEALEAFSAALRTVPAGAALAEELSLPTPASPSVRLKLATTPPAAPAILKLLEMPWRERPRALRDALVPSPEYLRACFPLARRGRLGLWATMVARAVVRVTQLPRAIAAVRRARNG